MNRGSDELLDNIARLKTSAAKLRDIALSSLKELEQYKAIGTVEEFEALKVYAEDKGEFYSKQSLFHNIREEIKYLEKLEDGCRQLADMNRDYGNGQAYKVSHTEAEAYKKIKEHLQRMIDRDKCEKGNCKHYDELAEYAYDGCTYGCAGEDDKDKPCKGGITEC